MKQSTFDKANGDASIAETEKLSAADEIAFDLNDPENPKNWSKSRKIRCLAIAYSITFISTFNASSQGATSAGFRKEHPSKSVTSEIYILTTFAFQIMLGLGPLFLAPISELFGRRQLLCVLAVIYTILFLPQALAPNFASILATRFFQGICASVEGPVIAGITADVFLKKDRGRAMATFVLAVYSGNGVGPVVSNWLAYRVSWHWVYWLQMCMAGAVLIMVVLFLPETRDHVILKKRAKKLEKETGRHYETKNLGLKKASTFADKVKISCTRPLIYLTTEPIVTACCMWIGFSFGITFLFLGAIPLVFEETYGFTQGTGGSVLICGTIGGLFGWVFNDLIQLPLYRRAAAKNGGVAPPEARLYASAGAGIAVVIGCFGFAWTAREGIPWIAPAIFLVLLQTGLYTIYLATYNYLADTYERYSSSAQAGQSLLRGIFGATFGFFGTQMYKNLHFWWASSLIGFIFIIFAFIPFILIPYGPKLRSRSRVASALWKEEMKVNQASVASEKSNGNGHQSTV